MESLKASIADLKKQMEKASQNREEENKERNANLLLGVGAEVDRGRDRWWWWFQKKDALKEAEECGVCIGSAEECGVAFAKGASKNIQNCNL